MLPQKHASPLPYSKGPISHTGPKFCAFADGSAKLGSEDREMDSNPEPQRCSLLM